jgi:hypothetical protein
MKILIDECLPKKLKNELLGYEVFTVREMGWTGKKNGELLKLMQGQIDVFITVDKNMRYQHQLEKFSIAFIVLFAQSNSFMSVQPLVPIILEKLSTIQVG